MTSGLGLFVPVRSNDVVYSPVTGKLYASVPGSDPVRGNTITEVDPAEWQRVMDVNLNAPYMLMKETLPHMIEKGGGSIINIASIGGIRVMAGSPAYGTSPSPNGLGYPRIPGLYDAAQAAQGGGKSGKTVRPGCRADGSGQPRDSGRQRLVITQGREAAGDEAILYLRATILGGGLKRPRDCHFCITAF